MGVWWMRACLTWFWEGCELVSWFVRIGKSESGVGVGVGVVVVGWVVVVLGGWAVSVMEAR